MAEPGATTLPTAAAPARDLLLATKLHIPRPRPGFLSRPRLLGLVGDGATRELTLVCAPAGFGKTTLLGDWARRSRRPVAWLSLDQGDNDPARFWRYVAAALDQAQPGTGERMAALLRGGAGPTRRCPWPRSGPRGSWPSCARPPCGSGPRRRPPCCGRSPTPTCPRPACAPW